MIGKLSPNWEDLLDMAPEDQRHLFTVAGDAVNHPNHYTQNGIECIDAIHSALGDEGCKDYCRGNVFKYLWRYKEKNGTQDLMKAEWYLKKLIELN